MKVEILSTGDEIRTGAIVDSNSAYIAEKIEHAGMSVVRHISVGDDLEEIVSVMKEMAGRSDIAIVTGGLGPTEDDLTAEAAAKAAGVELALNEKALKMVQAFFKKRNIPMAPSNRKQAMMPEGSRYLDNPVGTAPGFSMTIGRCRFFFMPGVPFEMRKMLSGQVLPEIAEMRGTDVGLHEVRTISTFGLPESTTGELLSGLADEVPGIRLGLRAKFPEIQVKLYASAGSQTELADMLDEARKKVEERLGIHVLSMDGAPIEVVVGNLLAERNATVAVAESCTGGLVSHMLTNVSGSSRYFLFSGVTYSNDAKMSVLGVSEETLSKFGAVHVETAKEMAEGARRVAGATYGLATTGIAGPDGGSKEKPVGTVCVGLADPEGAEGRLLCLNFHDRGMNKKIFAAAALDVLRRRLKRS